MSAFTKNWKFLLGLVLAMLNAGLIFAEQQERQEPQTIRFLNNDEEVG